MLFVLVYLSQPMCHTVVPETFIYKLVERNLKNYGINRNQDRLIYFSSEIYNTLKQNGALNREITPHFTLPVSSTYPLPNHTKETCFIGRMICFEGE